MKAVILAGGLGTRISEETHLRPKPMIEIGGKPIIWHIMKMYSHYGVDDFIICCGYKGYMLKEYFVNYFLHNSDVSIDLSDAALTFHSKPSERWRITVVDTGEHTQTGGRLKMVEEYLKEESEFCFTYGDGVANLDIGQLIAFHRQHGRMATVTCVQSPPRFGAMTINGDIVERFEEKPLWDSSNINGGFFVLSPRCLDFIKDEQTAWEAEPMASLVSARELFAFVHEGFWQPMDTLRDKNMLEALWSKGDPPWRVWS